jgi:hypothetical protein
MQENARRIVYALDIVGGDSKAFVKMLLEHPSEEMRYSLDRVKVDSSRLRSRYTLIYPPDLVRRQFDLARSRRPSERFPVDYVWVGPFERLWLRAGFPEGGPLPLRRVFSNGEVDIYGVTGK